MRNSTVTLLLAFCVFVTARSGAEDARPSQLTAGPAAEAGFEGDIAGRSVLIEEASRSPRPPVDFSGDNLERIEGLPPLPEFVVFAAPNDPDMDGLTTAVENGIGTDPMNIDSDCDGKDDGTEVGANPGSPTDTDLDGKIDALEHDKVDSDGDGTPDETDETTVTWQLSCLYFRPFAVKNDQSDSTAVEVRIVGASNPTVVKLMNTPPFPPPPFPAPPDDVLVGGVGTRFLDGIRLFDDGTMGDRVPGDGIWSRNTITSNADPNARVNVSNTKTTTRDFDRVEVTDDSGTNLKTAAGSGFGLATLGVVRPVDVTAPVTHGTPPGGSPSQRTSNVINLVNPQWMLAVRQFLLRGFPDNATKLRMLTTDFYKTFKDDFDFFIAISELDVPGGVAGIHRGVRNEVDGIGKTIFDDSAAWGSAGKLRSVIGVPSGNSFATSHEVMHHWGVDLSTTLGFQNCGTSAHWGYVEVGSGLLGGIDQLAVHPTDSSRFCFDGVANCCGDDYVPIELYLMGLVDWTGVPDITTLMNPVCGSVIRSDPTCPARPFPAFPFSSIQAPGTATTTIADVINTHGPRTPDSTTAQKAFTAAMVAVTQYTLNDSEMALFDVFSEIWGATTGTGSTRSFAQQTGNRATMDTTAPAPPAPPTCENSLQLQNDTITGTQNYQIKTTLTLGPNLEVNGNVTATVGQDVVILNATTIAGSFGVTLDPAFCP